MIRLTIVGGVVLSSALHIGCASHKMTLEAGKLSQTESKAGLESPIELAYLGGKDLLNQGRYVAALSAIESVIRVQPQNVEAINARGVALYALGQTQAAMKSFERALALAPNAAHILSNLGLAYVKSGSPELAVQSFLKSLRLDPGNSETEKHYEAALSHLPAQKAAMWIARRGRLELSDHANWHIETEVLPIPPSHAIVEPKPAHIAVINLKYPDSFVSASPLTKVTESKLQVSEVKLATIKRANKRLPQLRVKLVSGGSENNAAQRYGKKVSWEAFDHLIKGLPSRSRTGSEPWTVLYTPKSRKAAFALSKSRKAKTVLKPMRQNRSWDIIIVAPADRVRS